MYIYTRRKVMVDGDARDGRTEVSMTTVSLLKPL